LQNYVHLWNIGFGNLVWQVSNCVDHFVVSTTLQFWRFSSCVLSSPQLFYFRFLQFCKTMNLHNKILSFWPRLVLPYLNPMWSPNVKSNVVLFNIKWKKLNYLQNPHLPSFSKVQFYTMVFEFKLAHIIPMGKKLNCPLLKLLVFRTP